MTPVEHAIALPGDDIVARPDLATTHAITIDAPPERVWPWLVQMGWHRGGWYTARWVDRLLFPANWPSAQRIMPELQDRDVGDFIPDGPPESECGFVVEHLEPNRYLVLHSTTHLPLKWRRERGARDQLVVGVRPAAARFGSPHPVRGPVALSSRAEVGGARLPDRDRAGRLPDGAGHAPRRQAARRTIHRAGATSGVTP